MYMKHKYIFPHSGSHVRVLIAVDPDIPFCHFLLNIYFSIYLIYVIFI